ncbi:MAG: FtsX-like permease family protein [Spirochaetales bacterium]|nr:FtsX-like permease family protein [Spirochaetales bacterium]
MENLKQIFSMALKETRTARSKLIFCVASIALGTMALTSIKTTIRSLDTALAQQTRSLMGADLTVRSTQPLTSAKALALRADLEQSGAHRAELFEFNTMLRTNTGRSQLVWARAFQGAFPFYGRIQTDPPEGLPQVQSGQDVIVIDPVLREKLQLLPGSLVRIGEKAFRVAGFYVKEPGGPASASAGFSPVVYFSSSWLPQTGLLSFGSRVRYSWLFKLPEGMDAGAWKEANFQEALEDSIEIQTYREAVSQLQRFFVRLSYFISLMGLITLLLAGVGTGSAMAFFIRSRIQHIAVYRSLGASPAQIFQIYSAVALLLGLAGAIPGVLLGGLLPGVLETFLKPLIADKLPIGLEMNFSWLSCLEGLLAGLLSVFVFTLIPVVRTRLIAPIRILRQNDNSDTLSTSKKDYLLYGAGLILITIFILLLTVSQIDSVRISLMFAGSLLGALAILTLASLLIMFLLRRFQPAHYHLRQGLSNLFRPGNQTLSSILATGAGVFLLSSIFITQRSLEQEIAWEENASQPNVFVIDIQPEQKEAVEGILAETEQLSFAPMVTARLVALNDTKINTENVSRDASRREWDDQLRVREYFISYRSHLLDSEEIVAGQFWEGRPKELQVSVSDDWADRMDVGVGDTLSLNVQGRVLRAEITSLRRIRWQSMRPNAMILLSPGIIERVPPLYVASFRSPAPEAISRIQDRLVDRFSNLSVIDITEVMGSARHIITNVGLVINFLAALAILNGVLILLGTITAGRFARLRESMLLKVLGARRGDLNRILTTEFAALSLTGILLGALLAELLAQPVLTVFFQSRWAAPSFWLLLILFLLALGNTLTGLWLSRDIMRTQPLTVLREE